MLLQSQPDGFALGDFWSLTQQAGPLRWPIFFVLAVGLMQVFVKTWELVRDRRVSSKLYGLDYATMSLDSITSAVSGQDESMLSSLQSTMLNVFHTRPGEGLLHDEITNFVSFQQDQFGAFRRRMEFLSDTAGALGLMGTVWGMFTVFFQGTAEQDVILRGMGIALITTLLGLVVSIILNFSATELSTFFGKRLEHVSRKSDELRFRLMELAPTPSPMVMAGPVAQAPVAAPVPAPAPPPPPAPAPEPAPAWRYVQLASDGAGGEAGGRVDVDLVVQTAEGEGAADANVMVAVVDGDGTVGKGARTVRLTSDEKGRVTVPCTLPEKAGTFALDVSLPEQPGPPTRVEVAVRPGGPRKVAAEGNNQAAVAGMRLPAPIGVQVTDAYGNPVAGIPVSFAVTAGDGRLASGSAKHEVATDRDGFARTPFVLSSEAGQNGVQATVKGTKGSVDFVAFGTQV